MHANLSENSKIIIIQSNHDKQTAIKFLDEINSEQEEHQMLDMTKESSSVKGQSEIPYYVFKSEFIDAIIGCNNRFASEHNNAASGSYSVKLKM